MQTKSLYFTAPHHVELRDEPIPELRASAVLVKADITAVSAGTEILIYRGQFPRGLDDANDHLSGNLQYPLCYGYASVGRVQALGSDVDRSWQGKRVFGFRPHRSQYVANPDELIPVPEGIEVSDAVFLPNMETAVNLVQDAEPLLGECAIILGQGIVGLLAAALLRGHPLRLLAAADRFELRRSVSRKLGVDEVLDPSSPGFRQQALGALPSAVAGFDLCLELSGNPAALDDAIALTGFEGRIVVGSWYGGKQAPIDFGGKFHRSRIKLISSQVSTISSRLAGRWSKARRFDVAWDAIRRIRPAQWITHRFRLEDAQEAYRLLDASADQALQVVFDHPME